MNIRIQKERIPSLVITLLFLAYGLLRLFGGMAIVAQATGLIDVPDLREALSDVDSFMEDKRDQALIPFSSIGYLAYLIVMAFALTSGTIATLWRKAFGPPLIGTFVALWAMLFVNFQTINPKVYHLAVFTILFGILWWLERRPPAQKEDQAPPNG